MKLFLYCLIFGLNFFGLPARADTPSPVSAHVRYIKLVGALDSDSTYARLQLAESAMQQAYQDGDVTAAQNHYADLQRKVLKLFGPAFANLEPAFAASYPEAVASTYAQGQRIVFKPGHPLANAFNIDPYGVDHPWDPFVYSGPMDRTFLDEAHAFVGRSAPDLLNAALEQIKTDLAYVEWVNYGNARAEFPAVLDRRYRSVFAALSYAFTRRGPEALRHVVTWTPKTKDALNVHVQDSLANLLDFDQATGNFRQTIEMLEQYAQSCAGDLAA